jgi:hypothetical protein
MVTNIIVLGHIVSSTGIEVDKSKIKLIANFPTPKSVKDVRSFLGHAGFYRRFIKDFSVLSKPLSNLLKRIIFLNGLNIMKKPLLNFKTCLLLLLSFNLLIDHYLLK